MAWNGLHGAKVFDGTGVGGMKRKGVSNHAVCLRPGYDPLLDTMKACRRGRGVKPCGRSNKATLSRF